MKNKNMRELEKQWSEKAKKAAKPKQPTATVQKKSRVVKDASSRPV
ncbi:MAG: hypothetical protein P4M01_05655 [Acidobacteriota bacterium]|nr:hypothetical protein [Acidobacteriota bacterium]